MNKLTEIKNSQVVYYLGKAQWKKTFSDSWQKKAKIIKQTNRTRWSSKSGKGDSFALGKSYKLFKESNNQYVATITDIELNMLKRASVKIRSEKDGVLDW